MKPQFFMPIRRMVTAVTNVKNDGMSKILIDLEKAVQYQQILALP
jgi:hypothetical protein